MGALAELVHTAIHFRLCDRRGFEFKRPFRCAAFCFYMETSKIRRSRRQFAKQMKVCVSTCPGWFHIKRHVAAIPGEDRSATGWCPRTVGAGRIFAVPLRFGSI